MSGLREDDGWAEDDWASGAWRLHVGLWSGEGPAGLRALNAGQPPESGGGGGRGGRGARGRRGDGEGRDEVDDSRTGRPEDRPWTPIPRQAKSADPSLIPPQRRLKKTSRSA